MRKIIMKKDLNMEMNKKKKFVVPGVLQVCEVMLEEDLLGVSTWGTIPMMEIFGQSVEDYYTYDEVNNQWNSSASDLPWD